MEAARQPLLEALQVVDPEAVRREGLREVHGEQGKLAVPPEGVVQEGHEL